jgi:uncharacterized membrane protein
MATKATFGLDENVAAALTYVLTWLTGIIFLLVEKENKTVRFHAMQSILVFLPIQIIVWILGALIGTLAYGVGGYGVVGIWAILGLIITLIWIAMFVLWLFLMYKAYIGEKFKVPIVGNIAENQTK